MKRKMLSVIIALSFVLSLVGQTVQTKAADTGTFDGYSYRIDNSGTSVTITGYTGDEVNLDIPESINNLPVTCIGYEAFHRKSIKSVYIPGCITEIGKQAFNNCEELENVELCDGIKVIGSGAFEFCNIKTIDIPEGVETLSRTFCGCKSLKVINIPTSVKTMTDVFDGCEGLERISIPDSVTVCNSNFSGCTNLQYVKLPSYIKKLGFGEFSNCTQLKNVEIPDSVSEIGQSAFSNCSSLEYIEIPEGVTTIGNKMFYECKNLEEVIIPDSVTEIEDFAFDGCEKLKKLELPDYLSDIGKMTFQSSSIEELFIPYGVTELKLDLFNNDHELRTIGIPESVTKIDANALENTKKLSDVYYYGTEEMFKNIEGSNAILNRSSVTMHYGDAIRKGFIYKYLDNNSVSVKKYIGSNKSIVIPSMINGKTVVKLEEGILSENDTVKTVYVSHAIKISGVKSEYGYENGALGANNLLEEITFEDGTEEIPEYICMNKGYNNHIKSVFLPSSLKRINNKSFSGCNNLSSINIPKSVEYIAGSAFEGCDILTMYVYMDSYGEQYALDHDISFQYIDNNNYKQYGGFDLKRNGFCFVNGNKGFGYPQNYKIPYERYNELYGDVYTEHIYDQSVGEWGGNCYAMSAISILFLQHKLQASLYSNGKETITAGGYNKITNESGSTPYYACLNKNDKLTKLIERFQSFGDSFEFCTYINKYSKYMYGKDVKDSNIEMFNTVVKNVKEKKTPYILSIWWEKGGHALVVDSSREPVNTGDGWYRLYLYDPNNPYKEPIKDKNNIMPYYNKSEDRYIDLNVNNGMYKIVASTNTAGKDNIVGYDDNGFVRGSKAVFLDPDDIPNVANKRATYFVDKKFAIGYSGDDIEVKNTSGNVIFEIENGSIKTIDDSVFHYSDIGNKENMEKYVPEGTIWLEDDKYDVRVKNGYVSFRSQGDYAGIRSEGDVSVSNLSSSKLHIESDNSTNVNIVIEETNDSKFTSINTDMVVDDSGAEISMKDDKVDIQSDDKQIIDINVITQDTELDIEEINTNDVKGLDVTDGDAQGENGGNKGGNNGNNKGGNGNKSKNPYKVGMTVSTSDKKGVYKITSIDRLGNANVSYLRPAKKTFTSASIPATVKLPNGKSAKVTSIAANAFKKNKKLKKVAIGANVTSIGGNAFSGCKKLKSIVIKTTELGNKSIGKKAFKGIFKKAVFKCPKKKKSVYKKLLKKAGAPKKSKFK